MRIFLFGGASEPKFEPFGFGLLSAGGAEGSRTPVRKPIHTAFSERRLSFKFPPLIAVSQAI